MRRRSLAVEPIAVRRPRRLLRARTRIVAAAESEVDEVETWARDPGH